MELHVLAVVGEMVGALGSPSLALHSLPFGLWFWFRFPFPFSWEVPLVSQQKDRKESENWFCSAAFCSAAVRSWVSVSILSS